MSPRAHAHLRTCLGCRDRDDPARLLRIVARPTGSDRSEASGTPVAYAIVPDPDRRMPGRGAHLHPRPDCVEQAVRRKAFGRAFRIAARWDTGELQAWMAARRSTTTP